LEQKSAKEEEKRLGQRYLTDNVPKPKWQDNSKANQNVPTTKKEVAGVTVHRPKMKAASELDNYISQGLSEEEIIAKKKRELNRKTAKKV